MVPILSSYSYKLLLESLLLVHYGYYSGFSTTYILPLRTYQF